MVGPSEGALSGSGWVSMNTPATPTATAARARMATNSPLPAGRRPLPSRLLHRVGRVENDRRAGLARHDRQRPHVVDEGVVAEARAALGQQHVARAGGVELGDDVLHVPRREELALLDIDRPAGAGGGDEKIGLAAQEGGDLQSVDGLGDGGALAALVDVGDDRQAELLADLGEDRQRRLEPDAARGGPRCGWPCRRTT